MAESVLHHELGRIECRAYVDFVAGVATCRHCGETFTAVSGHVMNATNALKRKARRICLVRNADRLYAKMAGE